MRDGLLYDLLPQKQKGHVIRNDHNEPFSIHLCVPIMDLWPLLNYYFASPPMLLIQQQQSNCYNPPCAS